MASEAMLVDVVPYRWFAVIGSAAFLVLLGGVLLGFLGTNTYDTTVKYAYDCNGNHTWSNSCSGVQLGEPGNVWDHPVPQRLEALNGFWSLVVFPFNTKNYELYESVKVSIQVFGRNSQTSNWTTVSKTTTRTEMLLCDQINNRPCWGFVLVYDDTIKYSYYRVQLWFPDDDNPNKSIIGDVALEFVWYDVKFIEEQLTIRVAFLVIATVLIFAFWLRMRHSDFSSWTLEQKFLALLLLTLICLNNPFYPFEFLVPGWFFPSLDAALQVIHSASLLIYWLMIFDHLRRGANTFEFTRLDWLKPAVVGIYSILTFSFYVWFRVSKQIDPIFGDAGRINGLIILFFISALFFGAIMVWILVLMMLTIPLVWTKRHLTARYLYLGVPTVVCLFSILCGLFFGSFGPIRRTAAAFCFYYTLYNVYVWVLLIGYWPVRSSFNAGLSNASEGTPIYTTFVSGATANDEPNPFVKRPSRYDDDDDGL